MKISTMFKFLAILSFLSLGSAAIAGSGCCPSGKEGKDGKDKTEDVGGSNS